MKEIIMSPSDDNEKHNKGLYSASDKQSTTTSSA